MSRLPIDEVVSPDVAAEVWDDYLHRFGVTAYVAARYSNGSAAPAETGPRRLASERWFGLRCGAVAGSPAATCDRIAELAQTLALLPDDARSRGM